MHHGRYWFWNCMGRLATPIQTIAVVASLVFISIQISQQTDLARANNIRELASFSSTLDLDLAHNEDLAKLWLEGTRNRDLQSTKKGEVADFRYRRVLSSFLIFYENMYSQHLKGLLDRDAYSAWEQDLRSFVSESLWEDHWHDVKGFYMADFRSHVDEILKAKHAGSSQ